MKRILSIALCLLLLALYVPAGVFALQTITIVQQSGADGKCGAGASGTGSTDSVTVDATGGDAIIGVITYYGKAHVDDIGTWETVAASGLTPEYSNPSGQNAGGVTNINQRRFSFKNVSAGSTTITTSTADYISICVMVIAHSDLTSLLDQYNGSNSGASNSATRALGSVTPTQDSEIVVGSMGGISTSNDSCTGLTLAVQHATVPAMSYSNSLHYVIQTTAGAVNSTCTSNISINPNVGTVATYKSAASAAASTAHRKGTLGVGN